MTKTGGINYERNGITYRTALADGQRAVEQRLKNIIKLAVEMGRVERTSSKEDQGIIEGGLDVTDKRNI